MFPRLAVNKTILKPHLVAATGSQHQYYTFDFPDIPISIDTQHFIQSMHAFFINLANRQTDKRTRAKTFTSYFVGGNNITVNTTSRGLELVDRH